LRITEIKIFGEEILYILLENPDIHRVAEEFNKLKSKYVIIMYLKCSVEYEGRAKSYIDFADRLLISKPDGTLMIHGAIKREPINWQPPGSIPYAMVRDNLLIIRSVRPRPREIIIVKSKNVYIFLAVKLETRIFSIWATHESMVKLVEKNPSIIEEGLKIIGKEVPTPFGNVDLLCKDSSNNLVVLEFKRAQAHLDAVSQLKRYVEYFSEKYKERVRGILVAPAISDKALKLLKKYNLEFKQLLPPKEEGPATKFIR